MSIRAMNTAATGMRALSIGIDLIANNVANVNTVGFKRSRANFEDLFYQQMRISGGETQGGGRVPAPLQVGLGVRLASTQRVFTQGNLQETERNLDLAVEGAGFFQVQLPDDIGGGVGYTRAGNFATDSEGRVVTVNGRLLSPAITIPSDWQDIDVSKDGVVYVRQAGQTDLTQVGTIELAQFANPEGLQAIGENLFIETHASGSPTTGQPGTGGLGLVQQGFLETSNVEIVKELVGLIENQRAFELNSQSIKTADEMLQVAARLRSP
jgi:flagellar basal-body rod protein FlgG